MPEGLAFLRKMGSGEAKNMKKPKAGFEDLEGPPYSFRPKSLGSYAIKSLGSVIQTSRFPQLNPQLHTTTHFTPNHGAHTHSLPSLDRPTQWLTGLPGPSPSPTTATMFQELVPPPNPSPTSRQSLPFFLRAPNGWSPGRGGRGLRRTHLKKGRGRKEAREEREARGGAHTVQ